MRWRIDLEYDGTDFVGWQVQPDARSVQGVVELAVARLFGEQVRVFGSGRTDSGVHAEQQVASFESSAPRSARSVRDGLNAHLPPDVAVTAALQVGSDFDPRRSVKVKCYRYSWLIRPTRSPLQGRRTCHVRSGLDAGAMHLAAQHLVGTHDFSAFRATGCQAAHPVRTIDHAEVVQEGDQVHFRIHGNGFLRHMVRILAGTLEDVGRGRITPVELVRIVESRDRAESGKTAPAHGLTLQWVQYTRRL